MAQTRQNIRIISAAHLAEILNLIFDPVYLQNTDVIYRCYFWLAFMRVPFEQIISIRSSCADLRKMTLTVGDGVYPIHGESAEAFYAAANAKGFIKHRPDMPGRDITVPRNDEMLLSLSRAETTPGSLAAALSQRLKRSDIMLTYSYVQKEAFYCEVLELDRRGKKAWSDSIEEYVTEHAVNNSGDWYIDERLRKEMREYFRWRSETGL